jgi:excisionase family DNA binding protein
MDPLVAHGSGEQRQSADDDTDVVLLKARQVASLLGVSRSQAYAMMATGRLPVVRIGRSVRVPKLALAEWIKRKTESAA